VWQKLPQEQEMVITNNGKPIALLTPLDAESLEDNVKAVRRARAAMATRLIQQQSLKNGTSVLRQDEINAEIDAARQDQA
jgi:antitoxin (DNA-binding transcriptional repressor) of toxin-antitoxin stability system